MFARKYAILVGGDKYRHVTPLSFCGLDARETADAFRKSLQFAEEDVLEFTSESMYKPERSDILHHSANFLRRGIDEDALLVFYFSGHGMIDAGDGKDYLLPVDATPNELSSTGISVEFFADRLKKTNCKNIVMFIDACRDAIEGGKTIASIGADSQNAAKRHGIVTFFACDPKEKSYEIHALKHGSFTHCVLNAIANGGCDTVDAVDEYLQKEVPLVNAKYEKPAQRPYTLIEPRDKGKLAIFYSDLRQRKAIDKHENLTKKLADLYFEEKIGVEKFNQGLALIELSRNGTLSPSDARKLKYLEELDGGILNPDSFQAVWDAVERYQLASLSPPKQLDRLQ